MPAAPPAFLLEGAAVTAARPQPAPKAPVVAEAAAPVAALKAAGITAVPSPKAPVAVAPVPLAATAAPAPATAAEPEPAPVVQAIPAAPVAPATGALAGRVLNEDGRPLVGATVLLKGSSQGTSTDAAGNYSLEVPAGDNTLLFGYGGYEDEVVHARSGQPVSVTLTPRPDAKKRRR